MPVDVPGEPHLLLVAMHFPPSRASGVYRPLAMANHLARHGWRVTVVTVDRGFFEHVTKSSDPALEKAVHPRVTVVRAPMHRQPLETDLSRYSYLRANFPVAYHKAFALTQSRLFPDKYNAWLPAVVKAALRVHRKNRVSVVLATGNPWSAFGAAWAFGRLTRVPYVMDYRDSWTLDQFSASEAFPPAHPAWDWERRLVDGARRVLFVNEPMKDWHAKRYPDVADRMRVVENGYDPDLIGEATFRVPDPDEPLQLGYVGTVTPQLPHEVTWAGWELARDRPELKDATVTMFGHLGFFERTVQQVKALLPLDDGSRVRLGGPVAKTDIAGAYASLDVLLMMIPSSPFVTGGKVYEYMATGRPIVAIHTPDTAATGPLTGYPLWFPVKELTADAVADAMSAAARAARTMTPAIFEQCLAHAERYQRETILTAMDADLRGVLSER